MAGQDRDKQDRERGRAREGDRVRVVPPGRFGQVPEDADVRTLEMAPERVGPVQGPGVRRGLRERMTARTARAAEVVEVEADRARPRVLVRVPATRREDLDRVLAANPGVRLEALASRWVEERIAAEAAALGERSE
jgi:hypothetical protein